VAGIGNVQLPFERGAMTIGDVSAITDGHGAYSLQVSASQELGFTAEAGQVPPWRLHDVGVRGVTLVRCGSRSRR